MKSKFLKRFLRATWTHIADSSAGYCALPKLNKLTVVHVGPYGIRSIWSLSFWPNWDQWFFWPNLDQCFLTSRSSLESKMPDCHWNKSPEGEKNDSPLTFSLSSRQPKKINRNLRKRGKKWKEKLFCGKVKKNGLFEACLERKEPWFERQPAHSVTYQSGQVNFAKSWFSFL